MARMIGKAEPLQAPEWLPDWIGALGGACWVSDPAGRLVLVNDEAQRWFAPDGASVIGSPCNEVVRGVDDREQPVCKAACGIWCDAMSDQPLRPYTIHVGGATGRGPWALVWAIPLTAPDDTYPWIVHLACEMDRTHGMEDYLREVASRSARPSLWAMRASFSRLTRREAQILDLLSHDHDTHHIARELFVSYATVRNHVRHILEKLEVHSIPEAVARHLLLRDPPG